MINIAKIILVCIAAVVIGAAPSVRAAPCDTPSFAATEYSPMALRLDNGLTGEARGLVSGSFSKRSDGRGCGCDLAIAVTVSDSATHDFVMLMRGNEDGTFSRMAILETDKNPLAIVGGRFTTPQAADLDAIAVVTGGVGQPGRVALYVPRDHAGTIAYEKLNAGPWQVGRDTPRAGIVVGKFNRDQNLDIAIAGANDVTLLFGNGSGGFTIGQTLPLQGGVLNALAVGDFTSLAGTDDLAIGIDLDANRGSAVMIARWDDQTGQMKLATDRPISVGGAGTGGTLVAAADLTRPGIRRDLVVAYTNPGSGIRNGAVKLLAGQDSGLFLPASAGGTINVGGTPRSVALAKIDQDNVVDLIVSTHGSSASTANGTIQLFQGRSGSPGDAGFHPVDSWRTIAAIRPRAVAPIRLSPQAGTSGPGRMVLAAANDDLVSFFVGGGDGIFIEPPLVVTQLPASVTLLTGGLFTNALADTPLDLAGIETISPGKSVLSVWLGNGSGSFAKPGEPAENPPPILLGADPGLFVVANLDGDDLADLAVIDRKLNEGTGGAIMRTFRGLGGGKFAPLTDVNRIDLPLGEKPVAIVAALFMGQGSDKPFDIAVLSDTSVSQPFQPKGRLTIWPNDGHGNFRMGPQRDLQFQPKLMAVSNEFRAAGKYDLIITDQRVLQSGGKFTFWINNGAGQFASSGTFITGNTLQYLVIADVNEDNFADVITVGDKPQSFSSTPSYNQLQVFTNDRLEGFTTNAIGAPFTQDPCKAASVDAIFPLNFGDAFPILAGFARAGNTSAIFSIKGNGQGRFPLATCSLADFPTVLQSIPPRVSRTSDHVSGGLPPRSSAFLTTFATAGQFRNSLHGNGLPELGAQGNLTTLEWQTGACPSSAATPAPSAQEPSHALTSHSRECPASTSTFSCPGGGHIRCDFGTKPACDGIIDHGHCLDGACVCESCSIQPPPPPPPTPPNACLTKRTYPPLIVTFANSCG